MNFASWPARKPGLTFLIAAVVLVLSVIGISRLSPDASVESMFPSHDPSAIAMARVLKYFSAADELLVLATLPEGQTNPDQLTNFAARLEVQIQKSPTNDLVEAVSYRVDETSRKFFEKELVPAAIYYLNDDAFTAARKRLTKPEMQKQIAQNEAMIATPGPAASALASALLQDPLRLHDFIIADLNSRKPFKTAGNSDAYLSPDGKSLLIRIMGKKPLSDLDFSKRFTDEVSKLVHQANTEHFSLDISGGYAVAAASERAIRHDMIISVTSSVLFLQGLFILAYRRPIRYFLLAFIPIAFGVVVGFGIRSVLSSTISPTVAVVGGILAGLGIDYTVLYLPYYHSQRAAGKNSAEAVDTTTRSLITTLFAACVTSLIGFIAIGWSSVAALRDFSKVGCLGLFYAFVGSVTLLPAMLAKTDRGDPKQAGPRFSLLPLLNWIANHRRLTITVMSIIFVIAVTITTTKSGPIFPLESDLTVMHPRPNPPLEAESKIARRMGTDPGSLVVHLSASTSEQLVQRAYEVQHQLQSDGVKSAGVVSTYGLATLLPDPALVIARQKAISPGDVETTVSDFRAVIAGSSFSEKAYEPYGNFLRTLLANPHPPGVSDLLKYPRLAETIVSRDLVRAVPSASFEAITLVFFNRSLDDRADREKAVNAVRSAILDVPGATLTGLGVVGLDTEEAIAQDLPKLMIAAGLMVVIYLSLYFRNARLVALAMIPAIFSLMFRLAWMRTFGQTFNLVNLISLPLLIGIDVDYGIFLVSLSRRNTDGIAASAYSISVSAAANVLGFGSLITTSVPAIRSLGEAMAVGIFACYSATLFLLAPMLMKPKAAE